MEVFGVSVEYSAHVRYFCTASYAPSPGVRHWAKSLASPWTSPSATIFTTLYNLTALNHKMYPCEPSGDRWERELIETLGQIPEPSANDGIVPFRSQLWGKLLWAGQGDHLDVVGHFPGGRGSEHNDWLSSGARFDRPRFDAMVDAIAMAMLSAER